MFFSFKIDKAKTFLVLFIIVISGLSGKLHSQTTDGKMTFTVKTVTANGDFSPKHVLAIWVEDETGFVLTQKLAGDKRKEYLYTWKGVSGENVVDAITGETLESHGRHTVYWNCTDVNGDIVPDGTYTVIVEFTEAHKQGPSTKVSFSKGADSVSLTLADETNFVDIALSFEPFTTTGFMDSHMDTPQIYPNPTNGIVMINLNDHSEICTLSIFEINGNLRYLSKVKGPGTHPVSFLDYEVGTYILNVESESNSSSQMIVRE